MSMIFMWLVVHMYERLRLYMLHVMYICTTKNICVDFAYYACMMHVWFAVEVCIDFLCFCVCSWLCNMWWSMRKIRRMFGTNLTVRFLIVKLPTWLSFWKVGHKFRKHEWRDGDAFEPMLIVYKQVCACVQANMYMCTTPSAYMCKRVYVQFWACT